jgi:hypothetical protein
MSANLEQAIIEKLRALPRRQQREVLAFVEELVQKNPPRQTIWEKMDDIIASIPPEVLDELPADASENLDHYLYGAPKKGTPER